MEKFKNISDSIKLVVANGVSSLLQFLLIIVMTKQFGTEQVGVYSSSVALILPLITFMGLNLQAIQLTDIENKYSLADCYTIRAVGSLITVAIVIVIALVKGNGTAAMMVTVIVLVRQISVLFSETAMNYYIKNGYFGKYAVSIISRSVISVVLFNISAQLTHSLIISLVMYCCVWVIIFFILDCKSAKVFEAFKNYRPVKDTLHSLVIISLPLACVSSINILYNSIPKYFIEFHLGMDVLGVFSASSYISLIGGLFVSGITLTFATQLAKIYRKRNIKKFIHIVIIQELFIILLCILVYLGFYLFGDIILPIIFTRYFLQYLDVILLLIIATGFSFTASVLGTACTSMRQNGEQLAIAITCILALSASCYFLVPLYELKGAAYSMLITYVTKNFALLLVLMKTIMINE